MEVINSTLVGAFLICGALLVGIPWWHRLSFSHAPLTIGSHSGWMDQPAEASRSLSTSQSPSPTIQATGGPPQSRLAWAHQGEVGEGDGCPFPLLTMLDLARGSGCEPFATSTNAAALEAQARVLADQHWSEVVWLTGWVDQERLATVCNELNSQQGRPDATTAKDTSSFFAL